jgi:4-nitrophenyl phosphatase
MTGSVSIPRLAEIHCFLLDMDGTTYLGEKLLAGAREFIEFLDKERIPYLFLTNNSSKSALEYSYKFHKLGLEISPEKIFTSGEATCIFLNKMKPGASIYLLGTKPLQDEFIRQGFNLVEEKPDYAVLGFDTTFTYARLWKFCNWIRAGIPYITTHGDLNCPDENGFMPDIGATIAFIATSTGRQPDVVIGKPNQHILDAIVEKMHVPLEKIAMVGDRLYTDIAMGRTGIKTILVLSGETSREEALKSEFQADLIVQNIEELLRMIK